MTGKEQIERTVTFQNSCNVPHNIDVNPEFIHEKDINKWDRIMHLQNELPNPILYPVQPQAMNIEYLSREYRGHVCFFGGIDVQGVMIKGRPDEVREAVHKTISLLSTSKGGYICSTSHSIMPETPLDNIIALFETIAEYK